jgi:hypothetical protein
MKQAKDIAFGMVVIAFFVILISLITGCSSFGTPEFCVKTDYGSFCYTLPEMPALKDK